jgi:hypothetical protein
LEVGILGTLPPHRLAESWIVLAKSDGDPLINAQYISTSTTPVMGDSQPVVLAPSVKPVQLSLLLPRAPETRIHIHLTINTISLMVFLTTVGGGDTATTAPLGSFVYALPDVCYCIKSLWYLGLIPTTTEIESWSNSFDAALHLRIIRGIYY